MSDVTQLGFVDVGSRGGLPSRYVPFANHLIQVLCEPDPEEYQKLVKESEGGRRYKVIDVPLAHIDGPLPFNETINPTCSSILPVNHKIIDQYNVSKHFQFKKSSIMTCARYDSLARAQDDLPIPHIIKIDVQGFESRVLQGFGSLLHQCLAIELETHFYPIYTGQKLIHDIIDYLSDYDMVLRKLSNARSRDLNGDPHFDRDLVEVDAVFTKTKGWASSANSDDRDRLNLACQIVGVAPNR